MKKLFIPLILLAMLCSCCSDDDSAPVTECVKSTDTRNRQINGFDGNPSSEFFNQVVANFKFSQTTDIYSGGTNCPFMECVTTLSIQNLTNKKMTFDYNIVFILNATSWNYQGFISILPGAIANVGVVSNNCGSISLGSLSIQSANIDYE